jgi:hypothetical protein
MTLPRSGDALQTSLGGIPAMGEVSLIDVSKRFVLRLGNETRQ